MGKSPQRKLEEAWQSPARPSAQVWGTRMFTLCSSDPVTVRVLSNRLDTVLWTRWYRKPSGESTLVESVFSPLIPTPAGRHLIVKQGEAYPKPSPGWLAARQARSPRLPDAPSEREVDQTLREPQPLRCRDYLHMCRKW